MMKWIVIVLAIFYLSGTIGVAIQSSVRYFSNDPKAIQERMEEREEARDEIRESLAVYQNGNFGGITTERFNEMASWEQPGMLIMGLFYFLPIFLIGAYIGHKRWLHDPQVHLFSFQKMFMGGLSLGLVFGIAYVIVRLIILPYDNSPFRGIINLFVMYTSIPLCLAYLAGLVLLYQRPAMQKILHPLSYLGRMALTNYLTQSIVFTIVFYGYGFGLAGLSNVTLMFVMAIAFIPIQIFFSRWWLNRFRFGPAEWLWRSLTYGRIQPFRYPPAVKILPEMQSVTDKVS
jgi:uncharacterized protein